MYFDFLSSSPKNLIFRKPSNKNCCGVACFFTFFSLSFIVGIVFIMKFLSESKYSISYTHFRNDNDPSLKNKTNWNNEVIFMYYISTYNEKNHTYEYKNLGNNFKLKNTFTDEKIPAQSSDRTKIQYFDYELIYECKEHKCQIEENLNNTYLDLYFQVDELDYQSSSPIKKLIYSRSIQITKNQYRITKFNFKRVLLQDIGLFSEKNYTVLSFDYFTSNAYDNSNINLYKDKTGKTYIPLGNIRFEIEKREAFEKTESWYYYKRTEKSFMKVFSDICAIIQFIYTIINLLYLNLYSNFYDNYQIINHILSGKEEKIKRNINISKNINSQTNRENLVDNENQDDIINIDNNDNNEKKPPVKSNSEYLPEANCESFIKSSLYSICCSCVCCSSFCPRCTGISKDQILIKNCNEIVEEFYSIEHIIYNQILLENLLEDYRWNNENLKDYKKHEKLITLINNIQS